jgi:DNA mismatch repair ATPase MutS
MDAEARGNDGVLMLYQLRDGPFPKSFGIDAAESAGFPGNVVKRAMEKALELEMADAEESEGHRKRKLRIDLNEPYVTLLRKMLKADVEEMTMKVLVGFVRQGLEEFDEDLKKSSSFV